MATNLTKAQLEAEVERLGKLNDHKDQLLEEGNDRLAALESRVDALVDAGVVARPSTDSEEEDADDIYGEPELVNDPFDVQNPHAILSHPPGFVLRWINPEYRKRRGWQGWVRIEWDDEVGRNLDQYLNEVPDRMDGAIDNFVRRGDVILCRLPEAYFRQREAQRNKIVDRYRVVAKGDLKPDKLGARKKDEVVNGKRLGGRTLLSR